MEIAKKVEKREVTASAKERAANLINQAGLAITLRDNFIEGLAAGLELEGKWNFSFQELCFIKVEEPPCKDTAK
jgi:hypothetical protein